MLSLFVAAGCLAAVDLKLDWSRGAGSREALLQMSVLALLCFGALLTVMSCRRMRREGAGQRAIIDALRQEERTEKALLETLIASAPVGFGFVDADLRIARVNERAAAMVGARPEDLVGRTVGSVSPDAPRRMEEAYRSVLDDGVTIEGRRVTQECNGRISHLELSHYPVRLGDGRPLGVGVVVEDVTHRVETQLELERVLSAERESREATEVANRYLLERNDALRTAQRGFFERTQMLRALTDLAEDVMFVVDREGRCRMINTAGALAVGALPKDVIGTTYDAFLPREFSQRARNRDLEVMATGHTVVDDESVDTPQGARRMVTTRAPWMVDGETLGVVVLARTITPLSADDRDRDLLHAEARAAESTMRTALKRLAEQNVRLQELDRAKDEIVALVSHDLRTPLTSIRGYTELLRTGHGVDERGQRFIEVIERNSRRLLELVDDLLVVAQHRVGAFTVRVDELDLAQLVSESLATFAPAAAAKQIALVQRVDGSAPVVGDAARLGRMLDNLVANAVKFTQPGGVVEVGLTMSGGRVVLRVRDNGPGIAPGNQAHIFDHFARAREADGGGLRGIGLGLAIARAIAEAHAGTIGLDSSPGTGATFWVDLPVDGPPENEDSVGHGDADSDQVPRPIHV